MTSKSGNMNRRAMLRGGAVAALATPALIGKGIAQGKVTWRVQSHWPKASASFDDSLGVLTQRVTEQTEGAFQFELFGAGEFAKGPEIYNLIRKGVVPMGTASASYFQEKAQAASFVYGIPGTLRESWEQQYATKQGGLEAMVNEELVPDGVMLKSDKAYPTEFVLSKKIESAADFQGVKIRSSGTMLDYLKAAGAAPQYIPGSELYQALSSGVVDGAHWGAAIGAKSMSLWEVCKYHYKPALGFTTDSYLMNVQQYEDLDDDLRGVLDTAYETRFYERSSEYQLGEAQALSWGIAEQGVEVIQLPDDVLQMLAEASKNILETEGQKGEIAARAATVYTDLMKDLGYA
ncbi:ABC transporter substrate-binding protein [Oceanicola sp. 22II-s10i]|uniref:TRAP transporter substrate-binding protein DctP n=1 Tax=Oceanicola sp. 22II-s10i TaxID=1317116 RepID=UPI000B5293DD|nr:TRAP transporter substrate-binding protein DctP [Oceanicola sp. 22II-s10i]OWU86838.1 ABC transporter substrate-binding protein [Oceanicola sp. 22II-s10i]